MSERDGRPPERDWDDEVDAAPGDEAEEGEEGEEDDEADGDEDGADRDDGRGPPDQGEDAQESIEAGDEDDEREDEETDEGELLEPRRDADGGEAAAGELAAGDLSAPPDDPDRPVVLITGATDGIGKQAALLLARHRVHVIVHGRAPERVEATLRQLRLKHPGASVEGAVADLASLHAVHALADRLAGRRLDVLINNAGVYMRERQLTPDGLEVTFAVNYLAPFVLTHRLLPALSQPGRRVIQVSSVAHLRCKLEWDNLQGERHYDDYQAYATSKLALVLLSAELARRLGGAPPTVNAMHPGVVSTKLLRAGFGVEGVDRIERAAAMLGYLALAEDVAGVTGKYFADGRVARAHALAGDPLTAGRFYELTASLAGVTPLPRRRVTHG